MLARKHASMTQQDKDSPLTTTSKLCLFYWARPSFNTKHTDAISSIAARSPASNFPPISFPSFNSKIAHHNERRLHVPTRLPLHWREFQNRRQDLSRRSHRILASPLSHPQGKRAEMVDRHTRLHPQLHRRLQH